jgi:CIC family chloride channel protein
MCACLGAVVRAPVTGILIVFEMTHEFALVPALMVGALISQVIARRLAHESFYDTVLAQDGQHVERLVPPRSLRGWMELPAGRIANFSPVIATDLSAPALRELLGRHPHSRFPVSVDGRLAGVLTRPAAEAALAAGRAPELEAPATCTPADSVRAVADRIVNSPSGLLVVVDPAGGGPIGVVTLHDLLRAQMDFAREPQLLS